MPKAVHDCLRDQAEASVLEIQTCVQVVGEDVNCQMTGYCYWTCRRP